MLFRSEHFLRSFHLSSLEELPELPGMTEEQLHPGEPAQEDSGETAQA